MQDTDLRSNTNNAKTIAADIDTGDTLHHLTTVSSGNPGQDIQLKLSTAFCGIWTYDKTIFNNGFNSSLSTSFQMTKSTNSLSSVSGKVGIDAFKIHYYTLNDLSFLLVDKSSKISTNKIDGALGFRYKCFSDDSFQAHNLIEKLCKSNVIKEQGVIAIHLNASITFCQYPNQINENPKLYHTIKINSLNSQWSFHLYSIYSSHNQLYQINKSLSIGIDGNMFNVKRPYYDYLLTTYFSKYIDKGICQEKKEDIWEIYCDNTEYDYQKNFPSQLSLVVGKWSLKLQSKDLFRKTPNKGDQYNLWFTIIHYPQNDHYYLSQRVLGKVIVVYDKDKSQIGMYPRKAANTS